MQAYAPPAPMAYAPAPPSAPPQMGPVDSSPEGSWFELSMDQIQDLAKQLTVQGQEKKPSDLASFKEGPNYFRVLPPWSAEAARRGEFARYFVAHPGFNDNKGLYSPCYERSFPNQGFVCPVCQVVQYYERYMGEQIKGLLARPYRYCNAVLYKFDQQNTASPLTMLRIKPWVLRLPISVYNGLISMMSMPYIGNITDPYRGWVIMVNRPHDFKGKSSYSWSQVLQGPISDPETMSSVLHGMWDLDRFSMLGVPSVEKLEKQYAIAEAILKTCVTMTGVTPDQLRMAPLQVVVPPIVQQQQSTRPTSGFVGAAVPAAAPQAPTQPVTSPVVAAAPVAAPYRSATPVYLPGPAVGYAQPPSPPQPTPGAAPLNPPMMPAGSYIPGAPSAPAPAPSPFVPGYASPVTGPPPIGMAPPQGWVPAGQAPPPGGRIPVSFPAMSGATVTTLPHPVVESDMGDVEPMLPVPTAAPAPVPQPPQPPAAPVATGSSPVVCPKCGGTFQGQRGFRIHLSHSPACCEALGVSVQPAAQPAAPVAPAPAPAPAPMPSPVPMMAPPSFPGGATGPFPIGPVGRT